MKKKYRLLKKIDFQLLLKEGSRCFTPHFICYWKKDNLPNIQIGIIIPKKRCKLSCNRKRYKRIFWAINRGVLDGLPKIKCVFFYKDEFFSKYDTKELRFLNLRQEYLGLMEALSRKTR